VIFKILVSFNRRMNHRSNEETPGLWIFSNLKKPKAQHSLVLYEFEICNLAEASLLERKNCVRRISECLNFSNLADL